MHNGNGSLPDITNCTFTGNTAATFGGGGMVNRNSSPMVTNCTFIGNQAGAELAVGDGALGFWKALRQVYGIAREQRCWVHKTGNVLNPHFPNEPLI